MNEARVLSHSEAPKYSDSSTNTAVQEDPEESNDLEKCVLTHDL